MNRRSFLAKAIGAVVAATVPIGTTKVAVPKRNNTQGGLVGVWLFNESVLSEEEIKRYYQDPFCLYRNNDYEARTVFGKRL